jgi:hypothetical protein
MTARHVPEARLHELSDHQSRAWKARGRATNVPHCRAHRGQWRAFGIPVDQRMELRWRTLIHICEAVFR